MSPAHPSLKEIMLAEGIMRRMANAEKMIGSEDAYAYGDATFRLKHFLLRHVPEIEQAFQSGEMTGKPENIH